MSARKAWRCGFTDGIFGRTPDLAYTHHPVKSVKESYERGFKRGGRERAKIPAPFVMNPRRNPCQ